MASPFESTERLQVTVEAVSVEPLPSMAGDEDSSQRSKSVPSLRELRRLPSSSAMGRPLGRIVSLGPGWSQPLEEELSGAGMDVAGPLTMPEQASAPAAAAVPLQYQGLGQSVRVHSYCVADGFDRGALQDAILRRSVTLRAYQDVLCMQYRRGGGTTRGYADIFFFDSGVVVFWGLDTDAERYILDELVLPVVAAPLAQDRVERDRLTVTYSARGAACIEDDEIRLHWSRAEDPAVKLAVSFALAESTKLSVFEEDLRSLGKSLSYLPAMLADKGEIDVSGRAVMQLVGRLFLQQGSVNLLTAILDTPGALDGADDAVATLYRSLFDYLEVVQRVTLLNERFGVLREMLDIVRQQGHDAYAELLEKAVIWLVGICSFLAFCQLLAVLFGYEARHV